MSLPNASDFQDDGNLIKKLFTSHRTSFSLVKVFVGSFRRAKLNVMPDIRDPKINFRFVSGNCFLLL